MSDERESERAVYIIPPNFIETGSILGGMIKIRKVFTFIGKSVTMS